MRNIRLAANPFTPIPTLVIELQSYCPNDQDLILYFDRRLPGCMRLTAGAYLLAYWTAGAGPEPIADANPPVAGQINKT